MSTISAPGAQGSPSSGATNSGILSDWAAPYVTQMLGQTQALAAQPYQVYQGPMTAGESGLQTNAFQGLGSLTVPTGMTTAANTAGDLTSKFQNLAYKPTTGSFDATQASAYMNPYLQASLNPQLEEARRQSQITQQQNAAKMTQAGAFGGSRGALLDAETQRSLGANLANITGTGYNNAYDKAMQQFNADQQRKMQEAQYGATYGLQGLQGALQGAQAQSSLSNTLNSANLGNLQAQMAGGAAQRGIEQEGITADLNEFNAQRDYPQKMLQFQQSMLQGLPVQSVQNTAGSLSGLGTLFAGLGGGAAVASNLGYKNVGELLKGFGLDLGPAS
jgi:hypothetical protein